jgi:hypothetical protein
LQNGKSTKQEAPPVTAFAKRSKENMRQEKTAQVLDAAEIISSPQPLEVA